MKHARVVLATGNPHKVSELRAIFSPMGIEVCGLGDLPAPPGGFKEPLETGLTFEANAGVKALEYCRQTGRLCLADDSGLEIDALGGSPGVISSHFATGGKETGVGRAERDEANNRKVLELLAGVEESKRGARFVCFMALAAPGAGGPTLLHTARGTFEGTIGVPPRVPSGANGFGYDPLFLVGPAFVRTGAELEASEKNRLSHRAAAARAMAGWMLANLELIGT